MVDEQINQLNKISDVTENVADNVNSFSDDAGSVFKSLEKVMKRFRPSKMVNWFKSSLSNEGKKQNIYDTIDEFPEFLDGLEEKIEGLDSDGNIIDNIEELQPLLNQNLKEKVDLGSLEIEGIGDLSPEEFINDLQAGLDGLSERTSKFYEDLIENRFEGDLDDNITEYREESMEWIEEMNEMMRDIFHRDRDFREFNKDMSTSLDEMEDDVEEFAESSNDILDNLFRSGTMFGLSDIKEGGRDVKEQLMSMHEVGRNFMRDLGVEMEEWEEIRGQAYEDVRTINEEYDIKVGIRDYGEVMEEIRESGIRREDLEDPEFMSFLSDMGIKLEESMGDISGVQKDFMKDLVREGEEGQDTVEELVNNVVHLDEEFEGTGEDMFNYMEGVAPAVRENTDNLDEFRDVMTQLSAVSGEEVGEGLLDNISKMMKGERPDEEIFRGLDISAEEARELVQSGNIDEFVETYYQSLNENFDELEGDHKGELLSSLGYSEEDWQKLSSDERMDRLLNFTETYNKSTEDMEGSMERTLDNIGILQDPMEKLMKTIGASKPFQIALSGFQGLIGNGQEMLGLLFGGKALIGGFKGLYNIYGKLSSLGGKDTGFFAGIVKSSKNLVGSGGILGKIAAGFQSIWSSFTGLFQSGSLLSALAPPAGWIILGISAAVAGTYLLVKHWDTVKEKVGSAVDFIWDFVEPVWNVVSGFARMYYILVDEILSNIPVINKLWEGYKWIVSGILSILGKLGQKIFGLKEGTEGWGESIVNAGDEAIDIIGSIGRGIKNAGIWLYEMSKQPEVFRERIDSVMDSIKNKIKTPFVEGIEDVKLFGEELVSVGGDMKDSLVDNIGIGVSYVSDKFGNMISLVREGWQNSIENMKYNVESLKDKILNLPDKVISFVGEKKENVKKVINEVFEVDFEVQDIVNKILSVPDRIKEFVGDKVLNIGDLIGLDMGSIVEISDKITGFIGNKKEDIKRTINEVFEVDFEVQDIVSKILSVPDRIKEFVGGQLLDIGELIGLDTENISRKVDKLTGKLEPGIERLEEMFSVAGDVAKDLINVYIKGFNLLIKGLNKINFTAPDWIPGIGGKGWDIDIPEIPMLAEGAIAMEPTMAMVAESRPEAIVPLDKLSNVMEGVINEKEIKEGDKVNNLFEDREDNLEFNPALDRGGMDRTPQTVIEIIKDNEDVVDVIEWQTKKIVDKLDEMDKDKKREERNVMERKENPLRDQLMNLE